MQKIGLGFIRLIIGQFHAICQLPPIIITSLVSNHYVALDMGNSADANLKTWAQTVKNVQSIFPDVEIVISEQEKWVDPRAIQPSFRLIEKNHKQYN